MTAVDTAPLPLTPTPPATRLAIETGCLWPETHERITIYSVRMSDGFYVLSDGCGLLVRLTRDPRVTRAAYELVVRVSPQVRLGLDDVVMDVQTTQGCVLMAPVFSRELVTLFRECKALYR